MDLSNESNKLCIEIIYYPDIIPSIKSYYLMTKEEYEDLKTLYMDIYIENFLNSEDLTKDKLDIHIINNANNIKILKNFIDIFGNSFDILNLINAKKNITSNRAEFQKTELLDNFSDHGHKTSLSEHASSTDTDTDEYINIMTEVIDMFNKSQKVDEVKIKKLIQDKPNLINDDVLSELISQK